MPDRELLELAAKAAGIKQTCWIEADHEWFQAEGVGYDDPYDCQQRWNPLTDDDLALRLAVKLGLLSHPLLQHYFAVEVLMPGRDPYAATRRAIVRAAAEIGKI